MNLFKNIRTLFDKKDTKQQIEAKDSKEETQKDSIFLNTSFDKTSSFFHTFSTHNIKSDNECGFTKSVQRDASQFSVPGETFDSDGCCPDGSFNFAGTFGIPSLLSWYGAQGFIGYQMCAILSQHWLVDKACTMPARDSVRKGYTISINKDEDIQHEVIEEINKLNDQKYHINKNMIEYVRMGRIFGIRIAMFEFHGVSDEFYENPFNLDGVQPFSYKGICQIDPQWITPRLDWRASTDPTSRDYYEPTYWFIAGTRSLKVHKSHLMIMRNSEVPDLLKPSYLFGGVSIPQRIYERVYAAERTANEAPMLAMTKRLMTWSLNQAEMLAAGAAFDRIMEKNCALRDNFGIQTIGMDDKIEQHDTALADLDTVIMTQYQLVSAISGVPATKLLGTQVKGFNTTGEYEESSYHEELESIQECDLMPLLERHHQIVVRSDIIPMFNLSSPFDVTVAFTPLDALTEKEQAEINEIKANTASTLIQSGALDPEHERKRIISDETSGYNGISIEEEMEEDDDLMGEFEGLSDLNTVIENEK